MTAADAKIGQAVTVADLRTGEVWPGSIVAIRAPRLEVSRERDGLLFSVDAGFVTPR